MRAAARSLRMSAKWRAAAAQSAAAPCLAAAIGDEFVYLLTRSKVITVGYMTIPYINTA